MAKTRGITRQVIARAIEQRVRELFTPRNKIQLHVSSILMGAARNAVPTETNRSGSVPVDGTTPK